MPAAWLMAMLASAPAIDAVVPNPLPLAATAEITGAGFESGATSVKIGEVAQQVFQIEAARLRFLVALDTPLGEQTLTLTTPSGSATSAVSIVPAAPKVNDVLPEPLVLGELATVRGAGLETVTRATLGGVECVITEQTDALLVLMVPLASELLGAATLRLESPSGAAQESVVVAAPLPEVDVLVPNPVKAGGLLTVRGRLVGELVKVLIAAVEVPVVAVRMGDAAGGEVVAWVPRTLAPKPYDVVVTVGSVSSAPVGPLVVEAAAADAPEASGIYPARVAAGGEVWVAGAHLDRIDGVVTGLEGGAPEIVACERRACRLSSAGLAPGGPFTLALVGPSGAAVVELEVIEGAPVVPVITAALPSPATRGEKLTIRGADLAGVRSVVIGGVAQSIDFVDVDRVEITVDAGTSLGAETLFVAGNAGSAPFTVTVLDPLPEGVEAGPELGEVADVAEAAEGVDEGGADEGCASGGSGGFPALAALVVAALGRSARSTRRHRRG